MPEGPSIVILKELVQEFEGKKVIAVNGNTKIEKERALNQEVIFFKSWGKHFLICFKDFSIRIHFLLFGSYRINEEKEAPPRLGFQFENGVLNFYACSVKIIEEPIDEVYDWSADIMSEFWDAKKAKKKLKEKPEMLVCDALLDQNIFSGSGNIIKNEVLFRVCIHPLSMAGKLPAKVLKSLVDETRIYAFDFLEWKKKYELKKHWLAHTKKICPRCNIPLIKEYLGKTNRRTFFCSNCQVLYV
jgi:endonuclease-8